jgi:hypothetical protein
MEELYPNNTCGINVFSPLYIINDIKGIFLHDGCGITLLHKITNFFDTTLDIISFQSNTFQHSPLMMTKGKEHLWRKMSLHQHSPLMTTSHIPNNFRSHTKFSSIMNLVKIYVDFYSMGQYSKERTPSTTTSRM